MFRSLWTRVLEFADDALAPIEEPFFDADDADEERDPAASVAPHPHRRELRWERDRRPGSVPRPPAPCISPVVRRAAGVRTRDGSAR